MKTHSEYVRIGMPMPTKRTSQKKTARKRKRKAGKKAAKARKRKVARKTAVETVPTAEQVEEIENRLRAIEFGVMEPANWPKTRKEIQESLKDYREKVKWARMRGAKDKVDPEVHLHTVERLEEMLKRTK